MLMVNINVKRAAIEISNFAVYRGLYGGAVIRCKSLWAICQCIPLGLVFQILCKAHSHYRITICHVSNSQVVRFLAAVAVAAAVAFHLFGCSYNFPTTQLQLLLLLLLWLDYYFYCSTVARRRAHRQQLPRLRPPAQSLWLLAFCVHVLSAAPAAAPQPQQENAENCWAKLWCLEMENFTTVQRISSLIICPISHRAQSSELTERTRKLLLDLCFWFLLLYCRQFTFLFIMRVENGKLKLLSRDKKKAKNRKLAQRTAAAAAAEKCLGKWTVERGSSSNSNSSHVVFHKQAASRAQEDQIL